MNEQKLHGHANEYGVNIRKSKAKVNSQRNNGKHGHFMTRNAHHNARSSHAKQGNYANPHVYKRHVPKRVVQRPAFGSAVPRSPSPEKKSPPHPATTATITGKSARRNRNRNRGRARMGGSPSSAQGGSPGSPPQLQRRELRSGWSPAIIRGTSVTAHTHTSSSTVLSHAHRTITGVANAKEEDLGLAANSNELFQKELRN